ncbi:rab-GTPase-TBC domain-containing protein [Dichotomopilus funicola]|uniref:Rab-GTPase-TBC domain-containing protein n=1 Tax=Dichotomopilus funicola TaxID=1934379 RepID=A0AAN6UY60_9PEZI|nr:rab-GTPase-TBC domain-containing protein [Dichotomopilus funicola]
MEATPATAAAAGGAGGVLPEPLERTVSQQSATSIRSGAGHRGRSKRLTSQPSSSASSLAPSDKSLTSFPSFSPDSPREEQLSFFASPQGFGDGSEDGNGDRDENDNDNEATPVAPSRRISERGWSVSPSERGSGSGGRAESQGRRIQDPSEDTKYTKTRPRPHAPSIDDLLTSAVSPARDALFEEDADSSRTTNTTLNNKIPGALHLADDSHIERLIARRGAVPLVRQIAEDLAHRDVQIAKIRRRAEERERALRKIVKECGLSSLDLETRLRAVEQEARVNGASRRGSGEGISELMTDAMAEDVREGYTPGHGYPFAASHLLDEGTIRPSSVPLPSGADGDAAKGTGRGWKDYLWGGTAKKTSRANSLLREAASTTSTSGNKPPGTSTTVIRPTPAERRPALQDDLFNPPDEGGSASVRSSSRASSINSSHTSRKTSSLASMALRLVAGGGAGGSGGSSTARDNEPRGRATSAQVSGPARTASSASLNTAAGGSTRGSGNSTVRAVSSQGGPKALMAMRRPPVSVQVPSSRGQPQTQPQERWDTMTMTPGGAGDTAARNQNNYGPVEMDTILPAEAQPPTLTHIYNNHIGSDFLTDRFGFIYDQRRKKRQREAAHSAQAAQQQMAARVARHAKKGSRAEMMIHGRSSSIHSSHNTLAREEEDNASGHVSLGGGAGGSNDRPGTPGSTEEPRGGDETPAAVTAKPKRWQDYLKIATFPTELLSHTPSISAQGFAVLEAAEEPESPKLPAPPKSPRSPGHSPGMVAEDRGFLPPATTTTAIQPQPVAETNSSSELAQDLSHESSKEDAEPVRLLLENLNNLHDTLQREKTVRWNDFLRKVRAERRRDGEAAAAAAAAAAASSASASSASAAESQSRFQRATAAMMPETRLSDGELIGVASLGLQGKIGRAKANEFRALVLGGIPVAYRAKIWAECSGAHALRIPGYYASLVARGDTAPETEIDTGGPEADAKRKAAAEAEAQTTAQIKADITRTLTDNIFFRKGPGVPALHDVLLAYARRNPSVGYCQGMNLVVANLLLLTPSAEDAFWLLCALVESILPPHYFDHSLLASRADQAVLRGYVAEVLPRLSNRFDELGIDLETMTFQWFLSLFTDCLSAEALFRVWDVVLCSPQEGGSFLFQVALALLKLNETALLACESPAEVYTYINHQMTNHAISIDGLVQASEGLRRVVRREEVEVRRAAAVAAEGGKK